jgi:hypothetical protein
MKQFALLCMTMTSTLSLLSMQNGVAKGVRMKLYQNMYAQILSDIKHNPEAKSNLNAFTNYRLALTKKIQLAIIDHENNRQSYEPRVITCKEDAAMWEQQLLLCGKDNEAMTIMLYGATVSTLYNFALRKRFSPHYREDLKELAMVAGLEFEHYFETKSNIEMMLKEEADAHIMLRLLARFD